MDYWATLPCYAELLLLNLEKYEYQIFVIFADGVLDSPQVKF